MKQGLKDERSQKEFRKLLQNIDEVFSEDMRIYCHDDEHDEDDDETSEDDDEGSSDDEDVDDELSEDDYDEGSSEDEDDGYDELSEDDDEADEEAVKAKIIWVSPSLPQLVYLLN